MNKKTYIQNASMHLLPMLVNGEITAEKAIRACSRMWERLNEAGYGDVQAKEIKPKQGWYASMDESARVGFQAFWDAYGHKQDRDKAARAWLEIAGRSEIEAQIIEAAKLANADWNSQRRDGTRIFPQGWLSARRWEDYSDRLEARSKQGGSDSNRAQIATLLADIKALQALGSDTAELENRLTELKAGNKKAPI